VNFFDTADIYGATQSEQFLGIALGPRRSEVVIATKFGMPNRRSALRRKSSVRAKGLRGFTRSAQHRLPRPLSVALPDDTVPIADTLGALHELINEGQSARDRLLELHR